MMADERGGWRVPVITGIFGVIVAVVTGIFALLSSSDSKPPSGESSASVKPSPTASVTSEPPPDCDRDFAVTSPVEGTVISASKGVVVRGTACPGSLIWVLDFDPGDGSYFQVNTNPIVPMNGSWQQLDAPIGDPGDSKGTTYPIVVIKVTPECSRKLQTAAGDGDNTVVFNPMPAECPTREDSHNARTVHVVNGGQ